MQATTKVAPKIQVSSEIHLLASQALAIIAVDGIRPSDEAIELMHAIDRGEITHDEAIQILVKNTSADHALSHKIL